MKPLTLDQEIVLGCAFRYALGRMTYVVDSVASEIERHVEVLPVKDLDRFVREINVAIVENHAGMTMDIERWRKCRDILNEELARRKKIA